MAFTAGVEGEVKIWIPNGRVSRGGEHAGWRCRSSASHPSGSAITCGAFSADGSILATAANEIVLWDPKTNAKLATLTMPKSSPDGEPENPIKAVAFSADEPLFAACDGTTLVFWNLQTLQPWRVYSAPCVDLFAHPSVAMFVAVFAPQRSSEDVEGVENAAVVVRFTGRDATPASAYACRDGARSRSGPRAGEAPLAGRRSRPRSP